MNRNTIRAAVNAQNSVKIRTYSSSRSSKVHDFGTNRKRIYEFLLVINSNFGPILYHFWDTAIYWLKIGYFSYPSLIRCPRSLSSLWSFAVKLSVRKLESWGCSVVKVAWSHASTVFDWSTRVTYRRTDGRTDGRWHIARYSICCRALKNAPLWKRYSLAHKDEKLPKSKAYSRVFWIFLPNIVKIDL